MERETIVKHFTYRPPKNDQPQRYAFLREKALELAHVVNKECPDSREKDNALDKISEAIMWANAAIARNE